MKDFPLYNIRRIRKSLSKDSTRTLVHAFITARIDYCNGLLYGLPAAHLNKLQRIQSSAARLVCSLPRFCHITPTLFSLHWLPVCFRIEFKDGAYYCYCAYVLRIFRYSDFLSPVLTNTGIFLRGLKLSGESRS